MSVPTAPRFDASGIRPKCSDQTLEFWWIAPASADQTGYTLSCETDPSSPYTFGPSTNYTKITGLTNGQDYLFQITADNASGSSAPAFYRSVQAGLNPGAPLNPSAKFFNNNSNATVNFIPATSNGDATIKWYLAKAVSTDALDPVIKYNCEGFRSTIYLTGLNPNSFYNFFVNAVNDPGYGPQVSTGIIVPFVVNGLLLNLQASNYSGGSNWADSSSNANNASLAAGTGRTYKGYAFFDSSNYFTVPNLGTLSNWTIGMWIMPLNGFNEYTIYVGEDLHTGSEQGPNYALMTGASFLGFNPTGYTGVGYMNDNIYASNYEPIYSPTVIPSNRTWNNIVCTFDGSNLSMYVNSSNEGCNTYTNLVPSTNGGSISIGRNCAESLFGEALIYNRCLNADEVLRNYNETSSNYPPLPAGVVLQGLLLNLESSNYTSGSNWTDSSPYSRVASLSNGTGQKVGNYVYLNGATNFTVPSVGSLSNFTISAWYNPLIKNATGGIIDSGPGGSGSNPILNYYLGNYLEYYASGWAIDNEGIIFNDFSLNNYTWNNITTTFDGSNLTTYLNNSTIYTRTQSPTIPLVAGDYITIGKTTSGIIGSNFTKGLLGEALIYNRALSPQEVSTNYTFTSNYYVNGVLQNGLLLQLESSNYSGGSNWNDSSSNGNDATLEIGTGQTSNGAVYFDGSTYFRAPNLGTLSNWTLSIWYKPFTEPTFPLTILGEGSNSQTINYSIIYSPYSYLSIPSGYSGGAVNLSNNSELRTTGIQIKNNIWNNLIVSYDGSYMYMYLNNILVSSNAGSGTYSTNGQAIYIGGGGQNFDTAAINGLVGEVLIYNRAVTPAEIYYNYNVTASQYTVNRNGLILDLESYNYFGGNTWRDSSPYSNLATLSNGTACNVNGYMFLNGETNFTVPSVGSLSNWTLTAWYNPLDNANPFAGIINSEMANVESMNTVNYFLGTGITSNLYAGGYYTDLNQFSNFAGDFPLSLNSWNNITTTFDGSTVTTYLNNSTIYTKTQTPLTPLNAGDFILIGNGSAGLGNNYITGLLGEALIYNRALTPQEVSTNYVLTTEQYPKNQLGISIVTNTTNLAVLYNAPPVNDILYWGDQTIDTGNTGIFTHNYADNSKKEAMLTTFENMTSFTVTGDNSNVLNSLVFNNQNIPFFNYLYIQQFNGISSMVIPNSTISLTMSGNKNINPSVFTGLSSNITEILLDECGLTSLPILPNSLQYINLANNPLTDFTNSFPSNSLVITLDNCGLTTVPVLPNFLDYIGLNNNPLTDFTNSFPPNTYSISLNNCSLTTVPVLPSSLIIIYLNDNLLTNFTNLTQNLEALELINCALTTVPVLPSSLIGLNLTNNPLTDFSNNFPPNTQSLDLTNCALTTLPVLPSSLIGLTLTNNPLTDFTNSFPPNLESLYLINCGLTTVPDLPSSIRFLVLADNLIEDLTNLSSPYYTYLDLINNPITQLAADAFSTNLPSSINNGNIIIRTTLPTPLDLSTEPFNNARMRGWAFGG